MKKKVAIIGAGVSGLAAAKVFKEVGHDIKVFERSHDLGGVWEPSRSYPGIQTQSPKDLYRYTDKPMPADYPEWPQGRQVHQYLSDYAKDHDLHDHFNFGSEVLSMERRPNNHAGWSLQIAQDKGRNRIEEFDFVAAASGQFSSKNKPEFPGQDRFESDGGLVLHSSEFTSNDMTRSKHLLVLGFSKSATDIAVNAVANGAQSVTMIYRRPIWRIPYFIGGVINFKRILYIRRLENMFQSWALSSIDRFKHAVAAPFVWANWRALEVLLTVQLKLVKTRQRPKDRIEDVANCSIPLVTPGFFDMLADGRIKAIQGSIQSYDRHGVTLTGGERLQCDVVVLATGWKLGVPFLPQFYRDKLVEDDGQYRLYRLIANPDLPDMGFVGFNSSFCTVLSAELSANWLVRYADAKLEHQPTEDEMTDNIEMMLDWRRNKLRSAQVYGGLCAAPFHFRHFEELLADMGATKMRRNLLADNFLPPDADAFADYLRSTPDHSVR